MRRRLAWSTVALAAAGPVGITAVTHPSPQETRAEFERLCRNLTAGDNHFFGRSQIARFEDLVRSSADDPHRQLAARIELGYHLIRTGEHAHAIQVMTTAFESAADAGIPADDPLSLAALKQLAVAHLQLSEDQNCLDQHQPASCILPIAPAAVHRRPDHGNRAAELYQRYLELVPDDIQARWLLNVARMITGSYPASVPESLRVAGDFSTPQVEFPLWPDIGNALGVDPRDLAGGALMDDFDGDGRLDLISTSWHPCEPMKAFRNDGTGGFEDVTTAWGLDAQWGGLNLVHADYDNDGHLDLLVLRGAWLGKVGRMRNSLLRNDLAGPSRRFVDVTAAAGLAYPAYPSQAASWADFDLDGDLDLFIGNEAGVSANMSAGEVADPYPSQLFRNNGDGTFTDIARPASVDNYRFAKGAGWGDYDNDGDPDLYVSNFGANRLFRNNGDGTFSDLAVDLGVTEPVGGSFATWFFDYDNDGWLDIFVADYGASFVDVSAALMGLPTAGGHPRVYRNQEGRFTDVSRQLGLTRPHLPMGANFEDLDNDGWLDFYLGTGVPNFEALMPNVMYRNRAGEAFEDVSFAGGFAQLQKGHGVAFGDLDNDGDQDLYHQLGGAFPFDAYYNALFENPGTGHSWIVLRFAGRAANHFGLGARVTLRWNQEGGERRIHRVVGSGGSFGGSSLQLEAGLGFAREVEEIVIEWPAGERQDFRRIAVNRYYLVIEGEERLRPVEFDRIELRRQPKEHHHSAEGTRP